VSPWESPASPREPVGEVGVEVVPQALVTGFARRRLAVLDRPTWGMTGAVHRADGSLVGGSQRVWSGENPTVPVACDPPQTTGSGPVPPERLAGRWVYAGHWTRHFGHFLVETLPTLWPDPDSPEICGPQGEGPAGIVAHRSFRGAIGDSPGGTARLPRWQRDLLGLAGYGDLPVHVVRGDDLRVDELVVPTRPAVFRAFAHPEAVRLWQRIGAAAEDTSTRPTHARLFWSRTGFDEELRKQGDGRTTAAWDHHLDQAFAAAGFAIVRPETLPVAEQVRLARGAEVMAGSSGSALHHAALARPGCRVIEIGDSRNPSAPQTSQVVLDAALGRLTAFVPHEDATRLAEVLGRL